MKPILSPNHRPGRAALLTATVLAAIPCLFGQPTPPPDGPGPRRPNPSPDGPRRERPLPPRERMRGENPDGLARAEFLSEEQRASLRHAVETSREESRTLHDNMRDARRALADAVLAENADEAAIRERAAAVGKLEGDLAVLRARTIAKVEPRLTPDQIERLKNSPLLLGPGPGALAGRLGPGAERFDRPRPFDGPPAGRPRFREGDRGPNGPPRRPLAPAEQPQ